MGFYKILLQIVWHHLSSCNDNKAFDNLLASSNCMSFLWKLAACADLDVGGGGVGGVNVYFGLFYYVYLRYLDFQKVGGGRNLLTLCLGRSVHVDLLKMAVREGKGLALSSCLRFSTQVLLSFNDFFF